MNSRPPQKRASQRDTAARFDDPALRPRDPASGEPLPPTEQPGYYPGYSTLAQKGFWEEATRKLVTERVDAPPPRRFFSSEQWFFWETVFEHLIPQSDRTADRRVPLLPALDKRLFENRTAGYRFEDLAPDRDAYATRGIAAIDAESQALFHANFLDLSFHQQDRVLESIHTEHPQSAPEFWKDLAPNRFWQLITGDAIEAYYAHPWAWDEIGFGGPAYPRAYMRLERGEPESWEVREQPYRWLAPVVAVSDHTENTPEHPDTAEHHTPGKKEPQP